MPVVLLLMVLVGVDGIGAVLVSGGVVVSGVVASIPRIFQ